MASIVVEATPRTEFGKGPNRRLRSQGLIPAVVYGERKEPLPVAVSPKALSRILRSHAGANTIFELSVQGGGKHNVMIKDYQLEPIEHELLHADLIRVAMDHTLTLSVHVEIQGTALGVKQSGGMVDFVTRAVEVSCLPADIPETIVVDVSNLDVGQMIRAGEVQLPERVKLESDPGLVLVHVSAPRAEVEEEVAEAPPEEAAAEPEVIKKGKAEEEGESD